MIRLVVFDWNGTILNDEAAAVAGFGEILKSLGDERTNYRELHRQHFQNPIKHMYKSLGYPRINSELASKLAKVWESKYQKLVSSVDLQPGIREVISLVDDSGFEKIILSGYTVTGIRSLLSRLDFDFENVLANDENHEVHLNGKLTRLESYLKNRGRKGDDTIIIGDSVEEIDIAKKLQARSVIVKNGWTAPNRLEAKSPNHLVHSSELPELMKELITNA